MDAGAVLTAAIAAPLVICLVAVLIGRWLCSADRIEEQRRTAQAPATDLDGVRRPAAARALPRKSVLALGADGS